MRVPCVPTHGKQVLPKWELCPPSLLSVFPLRALGSGCLALCPTIPRADPGHSTCSHRSPSQSISVPGPCFAYRIQLRALRKNSWAWTRRENVLLAAWGPVILPVGAETKTQGLWGGRRKADSFTGVCHRTMKEMVNPPMMGESSTAGWPEEEKP